MELRSAKLERLRRDAKESELKTLQATPRINARSRQLAKRTRCADGAEYDIADIADRQAKQRQEELIRREQARKTLEEKQLEGVKETPTINSRSRRLAASRQRRMNNGAESLADRQTRQRRQELARHERARRLKHEMELEEAKQAKPHVSRGSARILRKMKREGRSVAAASVSGTDRLYKQAEAREQRRKAARESARELFSHQPKVNKQSSTGKGKGGARRSGRHSSSGAGGSGSGSVEETNLERDEAMFTLRAMAAQGDARAQALLAKLAEEFNGDRGGNSGGRPREHVPRHERLYREAQAKKERMARAAAAKREQETRDARTGEALFKPKINRASPKKSALEREILKEERLRQQDQLQRHQDLYGQEEDIYYSDDETYLFNDGGGGLRGSASSAGGGRKPVHERLAEKAEEYQRRAQERRERKEAQRQQRVREGAKTSAKSAHIVRKLERGGDLTPSSQRLRQGIGAVRQRTIEEMEEQMTFRPRINPAPAPAKNAKLQEKSVAKGKDAKKARAVVNKQLASVKADTTTYVASPGSVAKHSSVLSSEEVIEFRRQKLEMRHKKEDRPISTPKNVAPSAPVAASAKAKNTIVLPPNRHRIGGSNRVVAKARVEAVATAVSGMKTKKVKASKTYKASPKTKTRGKIEVRGTTARAIGIAKAKGKGKRKVKAPVVNETNARLRDRLLRKKRPLTPGSRKNTLPSPERDGVRGGRSASKENADDRQQRQQQRRSSPGPERKRSRAAAASSPSSASQPEAKHHQAMPLPHGWSEFTNEDGFVYYAHTDGRSQWEIPRMPKPTAASMLKQEAAAAAAGEGGPAAGSPTRAELDTMIRSMGTDFLKGWKRN